LQLRYAPDRETGLCYEFTAKGGEVWEQYARPQWDRFLSKEEQHYGRWKVWIAGVNHHLVEQDFEIDRGLGLVQEDTVRRKIRQPWQALYWKTITSALQISYHVRLKKNLPNRLDILYGNQRPFSPKWHDDPVTGEFTQ
jgi:hypothetical protein